MPNQVKGIHTMNASAWEDLKEKISTQLLIGKENGEAELDTITRIVWLEREKCLTLIISGQLRKAAVAALEAVEKTCIDQEAECLAELGLEVGLEEVEKTSIAQQSGVGLPKGKVLVWKNHLRLTGGSTRDANPLKPSAATASTD